MDIIKNLLHWGHFIPVISFQLVSKNEELEAEKLSNEKSSLNDTSVVQAAAVTDNESAELTEEVCLIEYY